MALALVACGASEPSDFGVNVIVSSAAIPRRAAIGTGTLNVTGDLPAPYAAPLGGITSQMASGELRFRYLPRSHGGNLSFTFDGRDAAGLLVARGRGNDVALMDGHAGRTFITLHPLYCGDMGDCVFPSCIQLGGDWTMCTNNCAAYATATAQNLFGSYFACFQSACASSCPGMMNTQTCRDCAGGITTGSCLTQFNTCQSDSAAM